MSRMLILARGNTHTLLDLQGRSIFSDLPLEITIFTNRAKSHAFAGLGDHVTVHIVQWTEPGKIRAEAERLHAERPFTAIAALDELAIDLAAELRSALGIGGLAPQQSQRFRNKPLMKRLLGAAGVRVPHYVMCEDRAAVAALVERYGKIVIKPVDGLGSREITFAESRADVEAWYARQSNPTDFEAEEFIEGVLYHINALVRDGKAAITACAPYLPGMGNIDFASGSPFVTVLLEESAPLQQRLSALSDRVGQVLELQNGVTHLECFVTPADEIVFCEIAVRPGGGGIVWMIEAHYGVNYARAALLLEAGLGHLIELPHLKALSTAGLSGFRVPRAGFVKKVPNADAFPEDWVRQVQIYVQPGDFIAGAAHCTDFVGLLIFHARDLLQFKERHAAIHRRFDQALTVESI